MHPARGSDYIPAFEEYVYERPFKHLVRPNAPTARWIYDAAEANTGYRLVVTDRDTGHHLHLCTHLTTLRIPASGRLSLKVEAYDASDQHVDCENITVERQSEEVPVELFPDSVARIKYLKTLAYAVHHDAADGLFCYESNGNYAGFDRDLVELVARQLQEQFGLPQLKVIPYEYSWDQIFTAPAAAQIDLAIASISITEERMRKYDVLFSRPYLSSIMALIVPRISGDTRTAVDFSLRDLARKRIGYHRATTEADMAQKIARSDPSVTIREAADNEQLFAMLANDSVDGILYDLDRSWSVASVTSKWIPARLDLAALQYTPEQYGIMFSGLNGDLKVAVDKALDAIGRDRVRALLDERVAALHGTNLRGPDARVSQVSDGGSP